MNCVYYAWAMHLGKHLHGKELWARHVSIYIRRSVGTPSDGLAAK
jgi:hypothetical protein